MQIMRLCDQKAFLKKKGPFPNRCKRQLQPRHLMNPQNQGMVTSVKMLFDESYTW
jgi:hypothetical protein